MGGSGAGINGIHGPHHLRESDDHDFGVNTRDRLEQVENKLNNPPQLSSHHFGVNKQING